MAKWELYKDGADLEALRWLTEQAAADTKSGARHQRPPAWPSPKSAVNLNMGTLVGSYATRGAHARRGGHRAGHWPACC